MEVDDKENEEDEEVVDDEEDEHIQTQENEKMGKCDSLSTLADIDMVESVDIKSESRRGSQVSDYQEFENINESDKTT